MLVLSLTAVLAACGGGGDGVATITSDPNLSVPLKTAYANYLNNNHTTNLSISGWIDNSTLAHPQPRTPISGTGTYTDSTLSTVSYKGNTYLQKATTASISINGQATQIATAQTLYNTADYTVAYTIEGNQVMKYSQYALPTTVKIGSAGNLATSTDGGALATTQSLTYSVAAGDASSLLVTLVLDTYSPALGHSEQTQSVYRVNVDGTMKPVSQTDLKYFSGNIYQSINITFQ